MKQEVPPIDSPLIEAKYIGNYLSLRLSHFNINTSRDLIQYFITNFYNIYDNYPDIRRAFKLFLEQLLKNARPLQCDFSSPKILNNTERGYHIRYTNQYGFNAIITILRAYLQRPFLSGIPYKLRNRHLTTKYPLLCSL